MWKLSVFFMEKNTARANHLERVLQKSQSIPGVTWNVLVGEFDNYMTAILGYLEEQKKNLAPSFVMIDPFGPKGSRMELIKESFLIQKASV